MGDFVTDRCCAWGTRGGETSCMKQGDIKTGSGFLFLGILKASATDPCRERWIELIITLLGREQLRLPLADHLCRCRIWEHTMRQGVQRALGWLLRTASTSLAGVFWGGVSTCVVVAVSVIACPYSTQTPRNIFSQPGSQMKNQKLGRQKQTAAELLRWPKIFPLFILFRFFVT